MIFDKSCSDIWRNMPLKIRQRVWFCIFITSIVGCLEIISLVVFYGVFKIGLSGEVPDFGPFNPLLSELKIDRILSGLLISALTLFVIKTAITLLGSRNLYKTSTLARSYFQNLLFGHRVLSSAFLKSDESCADWVRVMTSDMNVLEGRLFISVLVLLSEGIPTLLICTLLIYISPTTFLFSFTCLLCVGWIIFKSTRTSIEGYGYLQQASETDIVRLVQSAFGGRKEIRVYSLENRVMDEFKKCTDSYAQSSFNTAFIGQLPRFYLEIAVYMILGGVFIMGVLRGSEITQILTEVALFSTAGFRLLPSVNKIVGNFQGIRYAKPVIESVLKSINAAYTSCKSSSKPQGLNSGFEELTFSSLSFSYGKKSVFRNFSARISRGDFLGVIGESGSGKSTFINLVLGFVQPKHGMILINGHLVSDRLDSWWGLIGYVPQESFLIDDTIVNNVMLVGKMDCEESQDVAEQLLLMLGLPAELVYASTTIGEGGASLSGGQKQRVAIARALYRRPQVLILDEATSAMDTDTQALVMNVVAQFMRELTVLMITHRVETLFYCNKVLRLPTGEMREAKSQNV